MKLNISKLILSLLIIASPLCKTIIGQTKKIAAAYTKVLSQTKDLEKLMSFYADSVLLTDPIWGGQEVYSKNRLQEMYYEVLNPKNGLKYDFSTIAIDQKTGTIILLGTVTDKDGNRNKFNSNITLVHGKITKQTDIIVYPLADLKHSDLSKNFSKDDYNEIEKGFLEAANRFINAFKLRDAETFVDSYKDSVLYRDLVFGSSDRFSLDNLKSMFVPFLDPKGGWLFDIATQALDVKRQILMLKLNITYPAGEAVEYAGWFKFENRKIVEQLDFSMYPIKDLLEAPSFKAYFEQEGLEVRPISKTKNPDE